MAKTTIKPEGTETNLTDIGEIVKQLGVKGANSFNEKLKALDNLTTGDPLNGIENWIEVLKNARDELIH